MAFLVPSSPNCSQYQKALCPGAQAVGAEVATRPQRIAGFCLQEVDHAVKVAYYGA